MIGLDFSIIIPFKKDSDLLGRCIKECMKQKGVIYEVILLPDYETSFCEEKTKVIPTGEVGPALKRNIGAKEAKGKYLAFIDDDAYPVENWLRKALEILENDKKIGAVCGPNLTPINTPYMAKCSGMVFSSILGGGGMRIRYKKMQRSCFVKDFPTCNFIIKRSLFDKIGGFKLNYWPGEDSILCEDILKSGYKILYHPDVVVYHHRRSLFVSHLKQVWRYSIYRGFFFRKKIGNSRRIIYLLPSFFTVGTFGGLFLSSISKPIIPFYGIALMSYLLANLGSSFMETKKINDTLVVSLGTMMTHFTYGLGFIRGIFSQKVKLFKNRGDF